MGTFFDSCERQKTPPRLPRFARQGDPPHKSYGIHTSLGPLLPTANTAEKHESLQPSRNAHTHALLMLGVN